MKISVFGTGYVGLVTGACFAAAGNDVICVDLDAEKIAGLSRGVLPFFEPRLEALVQENLQADRIHFTTDAAHAVDHGKIILIAVGTPENEYGAADIGQVLEVAKTIGAKMTGAKTVVIKSTVPVGTAIKVEAAIHNAMHTKNDTQNVSVVSNPEFLKQGDAVNDFLKPDRIIFGTDDVESITHLKELYEPFNRNHDRILVMDRNSAELTKYAANTMLATKITFMNELANIAERVNADIEQVRLGIGADPRIGYHYIYPGAGFGGSCFPKDVRALAHTAEEQGYEASLTKAVDCVNNSQKRILADKAKKYFNDDLTDRTFAVWGLAFKPNTDDVREAPSRTLMEELWAGGANVRAYDPMAKTSIHRKYSNESKLYLATDAYDAVDGADALFILTEWQEFRSPDFTRLRNALINPVIFDGRNLFKLEPMQQMGFDYFSIGRPNTKTNAIS